MAQTIENTTSSSNSNNTVIKSYSSRAVLVLTMEWILFVILVVVFGMIGVHEVQTNLRDAFIICIAVVIPMVLLLNILLGGGVWKDKPTYCKIWYVVNFLISIGLVIAIPTVLANLPISSPSWFIICILVLIFYKSYAILIIMYYEEELIKRLQTDSALGLVDNEFEMEQRTVL